MRFFALRSLWVGRWRAKSLSIKAKLLMGCVTLIAAIGLLGVFTEVSQQRVGTLGTEIYDRAFLAMSYLRSSQNGLAKLLSNAEHFSGCRGDAVPGSPAAPQPSGACDAAAAAWTTLATQAIPDILSDVQIARDRALSPEGSKATDRLMKRLRGLQGPGGARYAGAIVAEIQQLQRDFDTTVEIYAGDGYHYRTSVQVLIERSIRNTILAIGLSLATAVVITFLIWRSIVPALRKAVTVAAAISDGKLDNEIEATGSDEAAMMLRALGIMQASLVQKMRRIDALAEESGARAAQLAIQNGRFEAALDNMQQGLCMFDADRRLVVTNRRYVEMFGAPDPGTSLLPVAADLPGDGTGDLGSSIHHLDDGRVIAASTRPVRGGGWVATYEDVTERHAAESSLRHMARHDALTGLPNRVLFRERVQDVVRQADASGGPSVLCLDLDGFKHVNDTHGHLLGDDLLRAVATRLRGVLQSNEMIARLGGDEFAVVLATGDATVAESCARSLVRVMAQPFIISGHRIGISASVGLSTRIGVEVSEAADLCTVLLRNADIALYRAKAEGKNAYRFYSPVLQAVAEDRRQLQADLTVAVEQRELSLVFQPLVDADTGRVQVFEALLRWHHPTRGPLSPVAFIPLAEESGAIVAIGQWVLCSACAEAARWPSDIRVAVNISPRQFRQGFLAKSVVRALSESGLPPWRLELEITESVLLQDDETVLATLYQLREMGVRIALDDFGTGYSSLSYLHRFPLDKIKVDKSFVRDLLIPTNAAILKAVVTLGRALDLVVVAEGVETAQQSALLKAEGCTQLQGFLFGKPEPAADVPRVLRRLNVAGALDERLAG